MATVYERVRAIVADKWGIRKEDIDEGSSFADFRVDEWDLKDLIKTLGRRFSIQRNPAKVSDGDVVNIHTVGDVIKYLKDHGVQDQPEVIPAA